MLQRGGESLSHGQTAHKTQYIRFVIFYLFMNQKIQDHSATLISIPQCGWWSELVVCIQSYTALCLEEVLNPIICAYELSVPQCFLGKINNIADGNTGWTHLQQAELSAPKFSKLKSSQSPVRLLRKLVKTIKSQESSIFLEIFCGI